MSTGKEEWLQRYLDGELSDEEERIALHQIADDPDMRALLKFDLLLRQDLASDFRTGLALDTDADSVPESMTTKDLGKISVPDSFFEGVMNAISEREDPYKVAVSEKPDHAPAHQRSSGSAINRPSLWERIWQPRPVMWRPVWSAGIGFALLMLVVMIPQFFEPPVSNQVASLDVPVREVVEETADRVMMRFVYVGDDAETVAVAGDFSDWEPVNLTRQMINGDVAWTGIIPLPRGEHRYMFIKDGENWATDPLANRFVDDGFGNKNAIVNL